jgi:hypothetical protein
LEPDGVDGGGEVTGPGDASGFDERGVVWRFDADDADVQITGKRTCSVRDALGRAGRVPMLISEGVGSVGSRRGECRLLPVL